MSHSSMDHKDAIDIAPAQSHDHQEVAKMSSIDKAVVTREPYGKPGMFILDYTKTHWQMPISSFN
jgi:hypothetical protein